MKTILTAIIALLAICGRAQYYSIELTNVTVVGGVTVVGDPLPVAFGKVNTNTATLTNQIAKIISGEAFTNLAVTNPVTFISPPSLRYGAIYPSNAWSLSYITNQMPNYSIWIGNSNGQDVVQLWKSNDNAYFLVPSNGVTLRVLAQ